MNKLKIKRFFFLMAFIAAGVGQSHVAHADWTHIPGTARDIAAGPAGAWVIGNTPETGGFGIYRWTGKDWKKIPGGAVRIDVDAANNAWVVNDAGVVYSYNGKGWDAKPGKTAQDIGVGADGSVYIVSNDPEPGGGYKLYSWNGKEWMYVKGYDVPNPNRFSTKSDISAGGVRLDVDSQGMPWVIVADGKIIQRVNANPLNARPNFVWKFHNGKATDIGVGADGSIFVLGTKPLEDGFRVYKYEPASEGFKAVDDKSQANSISVNGNGEPWAVNKRGQIFAWGDAASKAAEISGTIDPIALAASKVPAFSRYLSPMKGVFLIDDAVSLDLNDAKKKYKAEFKVQGSISPSKFKPGRSELGFVLNNALALVRGLGVPDPMPVEVTLTQNKNEMDLAISFNVIDTWRVTPELLKGGGTKLALKGVDLTLHAKVDLTNAKDGPAYSVEVEGDMYAQPSKNDPWLHIKPAAEIDREGAITFGGEITGACGGVPNQTTDPTRSCKVAWDVQKLGVLKANGGSLMLTYGKGKLQGVEASIEKGKFVPANLEVDGALVMETEGVSLGAGMLLKTTQKVGTKETLLALIKPFATEEPMRSMYSSLDKLIPGQFFTGGNANIVIAPTGLEVGHIDIAPLIAMKVDGQFGGGDIKLDLAWSHWGAEFFNGLMKMSGRKPKKSYNPLDVEDILKNPKGARDLLTAKISVDYKNAEKEIRKVADQIPGMGPIVDLVMKGFTFHGADAQIYGKSGIGRLHFTILNQKYDPEVPLDVVLNPEKAFMHVATMMVSLIDVMPPEFRAAIDKVPGSKDVMDKAKWAGGVLVGLGSDPVGGVRDLGVGVYDAIKDPLGTAKAAAKAIEDAARAVADFFCGIFGC